MPDGRAARRRRPVPQGRHDPRPDELPGRDDRRRAAGHRRPRWSPRPSPASPATPQTGARKTATTETGLVVPVPIFVERGRHDPRRHPDGRVPDPRLSMTCRPVRHGPGLTGVDLRRPDDAVASPVGRAAAAPARSASGSSASPRSRGPSAARSAPTTRLRDLWVEGEVGRVTVSTAGHAYFALKDDAASSSASGSATTGCGRRSSRRPGSGSSPTAGSTCSSRRARSSCTSSRSSRRASATSPSGSRQLKARLAAEGLFDAARKRPLPARPADDRRRHEPDGRGLARRRARPRPALAAGPRRARRVPGPGRRRAGEHRGRAPAPRARTAPS